MSTQPQAVTEAATNGSLASSLTFPSRYARFGTFQADLDREELYENGQRVKVQSKVFQSLLLLVSRAGEIVSREEVRRQLWPDTFLANLDANVNTTMNKLRQVLGDSPETPVYIETIPRRGYCFIADVEFSGAPHAASEHAPKIASLESSEAVLDSTGWFKEHLPDVLKAVSLLFAGIILGALLTFVWFFAAAKNQHSATRLHANSSFAHFGLESILS